MTLRRKMTLIIGALFVGALLVIQALQNIFIHQGFREVEELEVREELGEVTSLIDDDLADMVAMNADYSGWDDTYAFMADGNREYIDANITALTLVNLKINVMLFVRPDHGVLHGMAVDLSRKGEMPVPPGLLRAVSEDHSLSNHADEKSRISGILALPEGPMLFAALPVLTSTDERPVRGTLITGRFLDEAAFKRIARILDTEIEIRPYDAAKLPGDFLTARTALARGAEFHSQPMGEAWIGGYTLLKDFRGRPAYVARILIDNGTSNQGRRTERFAVASFLAAAVFFMAVTLVITQRLVLSRTRRLGEQVKRLAAGDESVRRIIVDGQDEIATLAEVVDVAFREMRQAREDLRVSNERLERRVEERTAELREALSNNVTLEQFKEGILQNAGIGICTFDTAGRVISLNRAGFTMLGCGGEAVGRSLEEVLGSRFAAAIARRESNGSEPAGPMETIQTVGGRELVFGYVCSIMGSGGKDEKGIVTFWDLTMVRNVECEMRRLERLVTLGEISASMAHELRNPLTAMYSSMQFLEKNLAGDDRPLGRTIIESMERMEGIIRRLSMLSREIEMQPRPVNLGDLVSEVLDLLARSFHDNGITARVQVPPEPPWIEGDPALLNQAILNLLMNAAQAMPGGGEIEVRLHTDTACGVEAVILSVADRGPGIPPELRERIFDPFFTTKERGTGIGLAMAERIVRGHGGIIRFEDRPGGGTVFIVEFPPAKKPGEA